MLMSKEEAEINSYMEICLYNKDREIKNKRKDGKATEEDEKRFENVFRTEVKAKNLKLNTNKSSGKMPDKKLETYYNEKVTTEIYSKPIKRIFGENDFFRIDIALDILEKNEKIRKSTKNKLRQLLILINQKGFSKAKKYWCKRYSEVTFRNHIKKIETLGINVLTFDKEIDGIKIEKEKIKNFTNLKNKYIAK